MKRNPVLILMSIPSLALGGPLVGTIVPPYPPDAESESGACVADPAAPDNSCAFAFEVLREDGKLYLYLEKKASPETSKEPRWRILDRMPYPSTKIGEAVVYALCERNGHPDQSILAVVKLEDTEMYTVIRKAFRANLVKGRFESLSTTGIRCSNEGWGV